MRLREIAERLGCRLEGDGADVDITAVAPVQHAGPGELTFIANARYFGQLASTRASAVILGPAASDQAAPPCAVLRTDDPHSAFARAVALFAPATPPAGIDPSSSVAADAALG